MKKNLFQGGIIALAIGSTLLFAPVALSGQTAPDACSKELLINYFPPTFVNETLKKFDIPKAKWEAIANQLASQDGEVLKSVEEKASKLNPNPFKERSPQQRQIAVKIFRETLMEKFSKVLKANGVNNDKQIQAMLDDIQQQKAKNFAACIEKQKGKVPDLVPHDGQKQPEGNAPAGEHPNVPAAPSGNQQKTPAEDHLSAYNDTDTDNDRADDDNDDNDDDDDDTNNTF